MDKPFLKEKESEEYGEYNEIDNLELHEVTICEKGINPEAKFDILKHEKGGRNMTEKLEKALEELNGLLTQVREVTGDSITKESELETMEMKDDEETMKEEEVESMDMEDKMSMKEDELESMDKALDEDSTRDYEAGEEVVSGGKPKAAPAALSVSKGLEGTDFTTLDLSAENVEKAYEAYKAEQLEAMAYDNLSKQFADRFAAELEVKKSQAERAEYDASAEVAALKEEFAELRKSLTAKDDEIRKATEVAFSLPEGFPTTADAMAEMSWGDIHNLARKVN